MSLFDQKEYTNIKKRMLCSILALSYRILCMYIYVYIYINVGYWKNYARTWAFDIIAINKSASWWITNNSVVILPDIIF